MLSDEEKEIFKNLKEYMQNNINNGYHKFVYNDLGWDFKCIDCINVIDKVLKHDKVLKQSKEIEELKEKNKRAEELYMQHNQMIIDILKECDYMIKNRYYMNDIAIRQYAEKIKDIAKYYIKEPEWIEIGEE